MKSLAMLFAAVLAVAGAARAGEVPPDAATLLFEEAQLDGTRPGDVLVYAYSRKAADEKLGPSFDDHVRLTIDRGGSEQSRTVAVQLFTGANHRAAGPFQDMTGNPILILFLENHIEILSRQLQVNPRYLKNAIRAGLRDHATVEAGPVTLNGRQLPGWHVRIAPFRDDANKDRMLGLDTMTYDFAVARELPGEIAEIHVTALDAQGAAILDEKIAYDAPAN